MECGSDQAFTAFVGIDWADTKHDICVQAAGSKRRELACIAHDPGIIESWACSLRERFGGHIAIALELTKGPIVYALQNYDFIVLFPINPATLARYRQAFKPSGAKDDPTDAELALDLLVCHRERFTPLQPQSAAMRTLILWSNNAANWSTTSCALRTASVTRSSNIIRRRSLGLISAIRRCFATF